MDLLKKEDGSPNNNDAIVSDCKEGLKKILRVRIIHCFRKANKCVDALGRKEVLLSQDFIVFSVLHLAPLFCPNVSTVSVV